MPFYHYLPLMIGGAAIYLLLPRPRPYPFRWGAALGLLALILAGALFVGSAIFSTEGFLLGCLAVYLLLPRPRAYAFRWDPVLALVALLLAGALFVLNANVSPETILFWAFSAIAIIAGALLITQHNPARAALSFALVVLSTCGLFLLLAAPFLMAATTIIYAGAIVVTFLFVIMLAQQVGLSDADDRSREPLLSTLSGFVLLGCLLFVLQSYDSRRAEETQALNELVGRTRQLATLDSKDAMIEGVERSDLFQKFHQIYRTHRWKDLSEQVEDIGAAWSSIDRKEGSTEKWKARLEELATLGKDARQRLGWLPRIGDKPMSSLSGPPPTAAAEHLRRNNKTGLPRMPAENSAYLGRALFSDFLLPVELGGTLLLVATVGAIAIAYRRS